jgi:hypothetical protein
MHTRNITAETIPSLPNVIKQLQPRIHASRCDDRQYRGTLVGELQFDFEGDGEELLQTRCAAWSRRERCELFFLLPAAVQQSSLVSV